MSARVVYVQPGDVLVSSALGGGTRFWLVPDEGEPREIEPAAAQRWLEQSKNDDALSLDEREAVEGL